MKPTHSHVYGNRLENCRTPETCPVQAAALAHRAQLKQRAGK